jgi:hypothetical protein
MEMVRVTVGWQVVCLGVLLVGCGQRAAPQEPAVEPPADEEAAAPDGLAPETAQAAREAVAAAAGVSPGEVEITAAEQVQWPDACLGLAEPDEMCAQVITPGWRLELRAPDRRYVVHTDAADTVRLAP